MKKFISGIFLENNSSQNQERQGGENQTKKTTKTKKQKRRRGLIYVVSTLAILFLVVFPLLINFYADIIVGRTLSEIVRSEFDGRYELTFEDVGLNVFSRDIRFKGVELQPADSSVRSDSANLISVRVPDFHLKGASWLRSVWKRELIIKQFTIDSPKVFFYGKSSVPKDTSINAESINLSHSYSFIEPYLDILKIESFNLKKGSVTLEIFKNGIEEKLEVHDFSVAVADFHLDSVSHKNRDRFFFSDSLGLQLDDGKFYYQKGPLKVSFAHLDVSTNRDVLSISEINFTQEKDAVNVLELNIPELIFQGIDIQEIVEDNVFRLEGITLSEPEILINLQQNPKTHPFSLDSLTQQIYDVATANFSSVQIGSISLNKSSLLVPDLAKGMGEFHIPDFNLTLQQFFIDSSSFGQRRDFLFLNDIIFISNGQSIHLPNAGLDVIYGKLSLNSKYSRVRLNDLKLTKTTLKAGEKFSVVFPEIVVVGEDFKRDLFANELNLKSLIFNSPDLELAFEPAGGVAQVDIYNLYPLIKNDLSSVAIRDLQVQNARVDFAVGALQAPEISAHGLLDLNLDRFLLDEMSIERAQVLYSENLDLKLNDFKLKGKKPGHSVSLDELILNTQTSNLEIAGLLIDTLPGNSQPVSAILRAPQVEISGIDFLSLYQNKGYFVDSLKISQPDITLVKHRPMKQKSDAAFIKKEEKYFIGQSKIEQGSFRFVDDSDAGNSYEVREFSVLLDSLIAAKPRPEFAMVEASFRDISLPFPGLNLNAHIKSSTLSTSDSIVELMGLSLLQIENQQQINTFELQVPSVSIADIPLFKLYHENALSPGKILINDPQLKITRLGQPERQSSFHDFDPQVVKTTLLKQFSAVKIDTIQVANLDLIQETLADSSGSLITLEGANLSVYDFEVDEQTTMTGSNLLFASDIRIAIDSIARLSENKDKITLQDFDLSTSGESFSVESIQYFSTDNPQKDRDAVLDFGSISTSGFDYFELIVGKRINLDVLNIDRPDLVFNQEISNHRNERVHAQPLDLYDMISGHFHEVRARDIRLNKLKLKITENNHPRKGAYLFEQIDFRLKHILIDSTNWLFGDNFLYSEDMDFTIHNFRETSADSLYDFGAAFIRFRSDNAMLKIDSGFLLPNYGDSVFAAKLGVQSDRLQFVFDSLKLNQFGLLDFIQNRNLYIGKAEVDGLVGEDYRNKRYPFPESHYPKLPASALKNLDFTVKADTFIVRNSFFKYREFRPPALQPGEIWFTDINIQGRNITNDSVRISIDNYMRFNASARLMGTAGLGLNLEFDLEKENDIFRANGVLNHFDMTELNPILEHVAFVKVTKGQNEMLDFYFEANGDIARGNMEFEYRKLHIRLIDKKTLKMRGVGESIASFIANTFVVRRNNPKYLIFKRKGDIYFSRDKKKSFFNYLSKSTLSGVNSTIRGVNEERKEKRRKREMERQLKKEGRLNDRYMRELNRGAKSKPQRVE